MYIALLSFRMVTLFFLLTWICIYCYCCTWTTRLSYVIAVTAFLFYVRICVWLRERGWWWCSGKREKTSFFFLLSRSLSIVFDWCDIWRRRPISLPLSLVLLFLLSVRFYLLTTTNCDSTKTERTRQDNCVHYWNKWSCYTTSEQNDSRERKRRDEWGNHFLLLLLASHKKITLAEWMNER
jgi:hypothetical protein